MTPHRFNGPVPRSHERTCVRACHAHSFIRAHVAPTTRVPAASFISGIQRDLICYAAATTPAKRIFDLVQAGGGERRKKDSLGMGEIRESEKGVLFRRTAADASCSCIFKNFVGKAKAKSRTDRKALCHLRISDMNEIFYKTDQSSLKQIHYREVINAIHN